MGTTISSNSAATYEYLSSYTFTGSTSTITFSNIPQTYTDLIIVSKWAQASGNTANYALRVNGSTDYTKYSSTWIDGAGGSASSGVQDNTNSAYNFMRLTSYAYVSDTWGMFTTQINSYSNTTQYKTVIHRGGSTPSGVGENFCIGIYTDTSAITSLTLFVQGGSSGNNANGSTTTLYGIKAA